MSQPDSRATFSGYAAIMLLAGICAMPQIGVAGLVVAGAAIYSGACFIGGNTESTHKRKRR